MSGDSTRDDYLARYDIDVAWRTTWFKLANDVPRARKAQRTQQTQERIERRARIANQRIAALMRSWDEQLKSIVETTT